ncbi:leucine dehydrogenase [Tistlia consotensis]|uniref:Leucine dehydrogenase n=1 Tax=Tistlia consotensis USBA 355 TaxID=560819 RepID=A0A1Y6BVT4_9PROT|nr:Glu/Leu/Phe/Val dehydrogenase dimerization domain-containing protein [Tistlia consotensis]SMF23493.1 leucine dehydrogenase [Tistlia consotensis USBA 355]SNR61566.1 leucine dehydrogenase [Tistlia consotensis]
MSVFAHPEFDNHERVVFVRDAESGLKAIVAVHDTSLGPALGGCRFWTYASDDEALTDVLRLSRGMTYKSALAGLPLGGGKSVVIGDARALRAEPARAEALFRALGRAVEQLGGLYTAAEDVGTSVADLELVGRETRHVAGVARGQVGDPSPYTAYGVFRGLQAAVRHKLGRSDLEGLRVAVQGLGHVGQGLCEHLAEAGAKLIVADLDGERVAALVERFGAEAGDPAAILAADCDVVAPCALGAVLNDDSIAALRAPVVAGAANNQLAEPRHGELLRRKGVLYAPDYLVNAGGIIVIAYEAGRRGPRFERAQAMAHIDRIHDTALEIFARAEREGIATSLAADRLAEERFRRPGRARAA